MRLVGFLYRTHNTRPTFQQPSFNSTGENKGSYVHSRSRTPLNYCTAAVVVSTRIPMRLQRSDFTAAAVDSRACTTTCMIPSDLNGWFFLSNSQHSADFILPSNLHSIPPAKTEDVPNGRTANKSPGYATTWYQERRDTPRRRL